MNQAAMVMDVARISPKRQVTISKEMCDILRVREGDQITFVSDGKSVGIVNSAVYAMKILQNEMRGAASALNLNSEEDAMALVDELRHGR